MRNYKIARRPTLFPATPDFMKHFLSAEGDPDKKVQAKLASDMGCQYCNMVGKLIYAMTTYLPDLSHAVIRMSQNNSCHAPVHYHWVYHALKYMYKTRDDSLYFGRPAPNKNLTQKPFPTINSNDHELILDGWPTFAPLKAHGYVDSEWATCPRTRRSLTRAIV